eukprot:TRINITY_DN5335_c0_g1_i1.p1 TRINITY_DN5335_c0_g1~~TRINITY_DN5335_c0_g1_i1.p1  ORF type:complete len:181 (-),score=30.44 TRINITY_DN5335_c0_g1_i1:4-546(-)
MTKSINKITATTTMNILRYHLLSNTPSTTIKRTFQIKKKYQNRVVNWNRLYSSLNPFEENPFENDQVTYHSVADQDIMDWNDKIDLLLEESGEEIYNLNEHDGIMEFSVGSSGVFVINKQPHNRQIWYSSPISGPSRYNYDLNRKKWRCTRSGEYLDEVMSKELSSLLKTEIDLEKIELD